MAQNEGGDGKGRSKFRTAEEDRAARLAARASKKRNRSGKGIVVDPNGTVLDAARMDRVLGVTAAALNVQRQREIRTQAYNTTVTHLTKFGDRLIPGNSSMRPRWTVNAQAAAAELLRLYFFGTPIEIQTQEMPMGQRIVDEVRRRFAGACVFNDKIEGTAGQEMEWFEEAYAAATEFHTERKAAKAAERANSTTEAPAETDKVLTNA